MNQPGCIHFHEDSAPLYDQFPERYQKNVKMFRYPGEVSDTVESVLVQNAFYVDFSDGKILRTRVGGVKGEDPLDFPFTSISHIEWFYGDDVPEPLTPQPPRPKRNRAED
jgi:hypothetical protein